MEEITIYDSDSSEDLPERFVREPFYPENLPDSDSSEDLPELFVREPFYPEKLAKNEIVWAKFRNLHWPAMVKHVDKNKKKVTIWYLDSFIRPFKIPFSKIHDFSDPEFFAKVRKEADASPMRNRHRELYKSTLIYIYRKAKGFNDDPAKFFDSSKPYFVYYNHGSDNAVNSKNPTSQIESSWSYENDNSVDTSDTESISGSGSEDDSLGKHYNPDIHAPPTPEEEKQSDAIKSYIKQGHIDQYLLDVIKGKISSEKHKLFVEALKAKNKRQLWMSTSNVVVKGHEKLKEISIYLADLYEKHIVGGKCEMLDYINSVWLPEALDKAASLIEAQPSESPSQQNFQLDNDNLPCTSSEKYSFASLFDNNSFICKITPSILDRKSKVSNEISKKKTLKTTKTLRKRCCKNSTKAKRGKKTN